MRLAEQLQQQSVAVRVAGAIMCAVLYGVVNLVTSNIASPFGFGQFRPAVVIPAIFSVFFGPWVGAVGGAVGSQITDSLTPGYFVSGLIAGMPANFIGFWLFGKMTYPRFSWHRFVYATLVTLSVANLAAGFLVYVYLVLFRVLPLAIGLALLWGTGLASWWFITMLPFVLILGPIAIRAIARAGPSFLTRGVASSALSREIPSRTFASALIIPGLVLLALTGIMLFFPSIPQSLTVTPCLTRAQGEATCGITSLAFELMYGIGGATILSVGIITLAASRTIYGRKKTAEPVLQ